VLRFKGGTMLYKDRIKNLTTCYPELTRVWIKTEDPRTPLKGVWISQSALLNSVEEHSDASLDTEAAELAEDHLLMAA
jgi:hypothetical protein